MGRDLSYRIISRESYEKFMKLKDVDLWDFADKVGRGDDDVGRNCNFYEEGTFTRDKLKEKARDAIDDNDFDTLKACAQMLNDMDEDDICVYENM